MLNICNPRIRGIDRSNIAMFKLLCGEDFYSNVVLCTTHWDQLEFPQDGVRREDELRSNRHFWREFEARGSKLKRTQTNGSSTALSVNDLDIVREIARVHNPRLLRAQQEIIDGREASETSAAREEHVWNLYLTQQRERMVEMLQQARANVREQLAQNQAQLQREFEEFEADISQEDRDARLQLAREVEQLEFERKQLEKRLQGESTRYSLRSDDHKRKMEELLEQQQLLEGERSKRLRDLESRTKEEHEQIQKNCKRQKIGRLICGEPKKGGCGRDINTRKEKYYRKSSSASFAFALCYTIHC